MRLHWNSCHCSVIPEQTCSDVNQNIQALVNLPDKAKIEQNTKRHIKIIYGSIYCYIKPNKYYLVFEKLYC